MFQLNGELTIPQATIVMSMRTVTNRFSRKYFMILFNIDHSIGVRFFSQAFNSFSQAGRTGNNPVTRNTLHQLPCDYRSHILYPQ